MPHAKRHTPRSAIAEPTRRTFLHTGTGAVSMMIAPAFLDFGPSRTAQATPIEALETKEVAPGVYVHTGDHALYTPDNHGDISNAGFIIGNNAVAVIDTSGSYHVGNRLRAAVLARTDRPVRYVINTHMHPDHVFGNAAFEDPATAILAHHKMARGLSARAERYISINRENMGAAAFEGTRIVLPTRGLATSETLDLGGRKLVLTPRTTAHTDNDLTVFDEKTATLFAGDLVFSGHTPTLDGSILGWSKVLAELQAQKPALIVPGHGPAALALDDALTPMNTYLSAVISGVRAAIENGQTLREAVENVGWEQKDDWKLFSEYHGRNISAAYAELEWE
ncbi:MAG: quinoprotein relay system zinc metallohydrolase 2 [Pseudomonadota bacterium]